MPNYVRKLLEDAKSQGMTFVVYYDDENEDYRGDDVDEAMAAIEACDVMNLSLLLGTRQMGWALIVNGLAEDEVIANFVGDWINAWWNANVR